LKDDTKMLTLALPNFCVGHSAAVLTCLEHNHKRWLPVARAFVYQRLAMIVSAAVLWPGAQPLMVAAD
jgi:hypothetical protein